MATYVDGSQVEVSSFYRRPSITTTTTTIAPSVSANMGSTTYAYIFQGLRRVRRCSSSDIHNDQEYARGYRFIWKEVRSQQSKSISDLSPRHNGRPSQNRTWA